MNAIANAPTESPTMTAELEAAQAAMQGHTRARLLIAHRALWRLARDPNDLPQVFLLNLALNAGHMPTFLARFAMEPEGLALLQQQPRIDTSQVDFDALRALPADTLGGAYARFLDDNGLDSDVFQSPPGLPPLPTYLVQRMRQSHDLWHVLTGYQTDVAGEIQILAFTYAQTRMPGVGLLAAVGCLRFGWRYPGIFRKAWRAYRRGSQTTFLAAQPWERMWQRPLAELQAELCVTPSSAAA
jgi:ubiquinone biosynthesis protein COQ4